MNPTQVGAPPAPPADVPPHDEVPPPAGLPERSGSTAVPRLRGQRAPLRVTLVALVVTLVGVALLVTGYVSTSLLRGYLTEQQDAQLRTVADELATEPDEALRLCSLSTLRFPTGNYLACVFADGSEDRVFRPPTTPTSALPDISSITPSTATGSPFTARGDDGSRWRLIATEYPGGDVLVIGIDLAPDEAVLGRLVALESVIGVLVLLGAGIAGSVLVRRSLRPLVDVERTAQAIAAGDLSRRVNVGDDRTEVGRLSRALNGMLARIEGSFRAQQASEEQARASEEQARRSEEQARASEESARASEVRMRRFVADASHELRTPLTSIRGFAELHRHGAAASPEDTARMMRRIESEATRMSMLVEDLLQLARLDQQRELSLTPVDLAELAGDAVHDARAVQPERTITLHLDESLSDVPVVLGDEARLRQVFGNLVTNALTHTPPSARVDVVVSEPDDDPDTLVVSVTDAGPGLGPGDAERVFERFYRADASRTRAAGGTGLGLSIVASLVAAHGGRVDLRTAPGEGATFAVRLPRSGPPDQAG